MKISRIAAGAAFAASLAAGAAQAGTIYGTGTVEIVGVDASTASIGLGTTFTQTLFSSITETKGRFIPVDAQLITTNPVTATVGAAVSFTAPFGSFAGSISTANVSGQPNNPKVSLYALGTFTPAGSLASFTPGSMSLAFTFTQPGGPGSPVNGAYDIAAPAGLSNVPEPMSLALFGMGLTGLGLAARRKA